MASKDQASFAARVIGAASQGAAGAMVAAALSAVTEPIVNRVLVKRIPLTEAMKEVDVATIKRFFNTTITTNFIKFPFFEVINMIMSGVSLPASGRGAVLGAVFTTATLPITNYRYCKSVGLPVDANALYKAYLPTVIRDIVYGIARNNVYSSLLASYPELAKSAGGKFMLMFLTVLASCLISAPGNELRGYYLQPEGKRQSFSKFFKPHKFVRSTAVGALIMSTALGFGTLATEPAKALVEKVKNYFSDNPLAVVIIAALVVHESRAAARHAELVEAKKKNE